jgi:hypothetical protein
MRLFVILQILCNMLSKACYKFVVFFVVVVGGGGGGGSGGGCSDVRLFNAF